MISRIGKVASGALFNNLQKMRRIEEEHGVVEHLLPD
jgi:hypothetical protein